LYIRIGGGFLELKVAKRAGKLEAFTADKIKNGIMKAGGTAELAGEVAVNTAKWAKKTAKGGVVSAVDIHNKVIELLYDKDQEIADKFKGFVKGH
jgi:transcriptional regulator NrdR family protein